MFERVKRFLRWLFPVRCLTMEEFAARVRQTGCQDVVVRPVMESGDIVEDGLISLRLIALRYGVMTSARSAFGGWYVYQDCYFTRFSSDPDFHDDEVKEKAMAEMCRRVEADYRKLQELLPDVRITLLDLPVKPLTA